MSAVGHVYLALSPLERAPLCRHVPIHHYLIARILLFNPLSTTVQTWRTTVRPLRTMAQPWTWPEGSGPRPRHHSLSTCIPKGFTIVLKRLNDGVVYMMRIVVESVVSRDDCLKTLQPHLVPGHCGLVGQVDRQWWWRRRLQVCTLRPVHCAHRELLCSHRAGRWRREGRVRRSCQLASVALFFPDLLPGRSTELWCVM